MRNDFEHIKQFREHSFAFKCQTASFWTLKSIFNDTFSMAIAHWSLNKLYDALSATI